jgi:uncharacterized protein YceH (UPF0502 family)
VPDRIAELEAETSRLAADRDAFRDQRNAVIKDNECLIARAQESGEARTRAENTTRTAQREIKQLLARVAELEATLERYVGKEPTVAEEMAYLNRCLNAVLEVCREAEKQATRWEHPLPVPEWVATVRQAASGELPPGIEVDLLALLADRDREIAELKAAEPTLDDDQPGVPL